LRCLRGIDTLSALGLAAETSDFDRFRRAEEFMAFVDLVPSEHFSGQRRRQGSITKVGNSHVRRLLVEAAWHAHRRPKVGYELARRQRGQDALVVERSWRCQRRLYQRWQRMAARGKPHQKIVVACARELAGVRIPPWLYRRRPAPFMANVRAKVEATRLAHGGRTARPGADVEQPQEGVASEELPDPRPNVAPSPPDLEVVSLAALQEVHALHRLLLRSVWGLDLADGCRRRRALP
jgi:hypothetical protein